jgi:hypothetical protein
MATINASQEAHLKIMKQRRKMEEKEGKVISISEALDVLLEATVKEYLTVKKEGGE